LECAKSRLRRFNLVLTSDLLGLSDRVLFEELRITMASSPIKAGRLINEKVSLKGMGIFER
jgi:hypothetical protein